MAPTIGERVSWEPAATDLREAPCGEGNLTPWLALALVYLTTVVFTETITIIDAPSSTKNKEGKRRQFDKDSSDETIERIKAKIRAKVEHPFRLFKCVFGYTKVRYRGLAKNKIRLNVMAGLANLITMKRYLLA